jgi:hypothetical protein
LDKFCQVKPLVKPRVTFILMKFPAKAFLCLADVSR